MLHYFSTILQISTSLRVLWPAYGLFMLTQIGQLSLEATKEQGGTERSSMFGRVEPQNDKERNASRKNIIVVRTNVCEYSCPITKRKSVSHSLNSRPHTWNWDWALIITLCKWEWVVDRYCRIVCCAWFLFARLSRTLFIPHQPHQSTVGSRRLDFLFVFGGQEVFSFG